MKTAVEMNPAAALAGLNEALTAAGRELAELRRANRATDAEIRRLRTVTRRSLGRIEENLRHVEAVR